ncbi:MAG: hypothetical protein ACKO3R_09535 [bacterium]
MSEVNTIGASSTLTEKKLEASIVADTDISPQTSVEAQKNPLDKNKDSFISAEELKNKVKTIQTAEANPRPISATKQTKIVKSTWEEVAKASNKSIPEQKEIKIGKQTVTLGSQETIATTGSGSDTTDIKINSLTTKQEIKELQTGISEETKNIARTQNAAGTVISEVQARIDKMRKEVRENTVPEAERNQERDVETSSNTSIQKLDTSRAALNERIIKLETATKDNSETFNAAQKAKIQNEITALQTERNRIDKETKIVQLSNGAMIKYTGSDLVEIGSGDTQIYEQKLSGNYKNNVRKVQGDGTLSTDIETEATRDHAYKEFKARYKAQTGKELELKENQRLVMYKRADDVIYQIIESSLDNENNRTTVISKEIKEAEAKQNGTENEVDGLSGIQGIKGQGNIEVKKFSFDDTKAGKSNGRTGTGSKYTASLGYSLASESTTSLATQGENRSGITVPLENINISEGNITGEGRYIRNTYKITPTDEQVKLLRTTSKYNVFSEDKKDANDGSYTISQNDLKTLSTELNSSIYKPVVDSLNKGGNLSDITLNQIDLNQINDSNYSEDIKNYRYRVLMTYWMLHPERRDDKFTKILKNYDKNDSSLFSTEPMPQSWIDALNNELRAG